MNEKPQTRSTPSSHRTLATPVLAASLCLAASLTFVPSAGAGDPELNPERGGSEIDLNAALMGPEGPGPGDFQRVHQQYPHMPMPGDPELTTLVGYDVDRIYALCLEDPGRNDVNCIDSPPGGLDHAVAGTGLRNTGDGSIQLRGVPNTAIPMAAWIYWGMIASTEENPQDLATAFFDGVQVIGKEVGTSDEPCWQPTGGAQFYTFKAPVLRFLETRVNGIYSFSTLLSSITDGTDPWLNTGTPPFSEGATLVVVYSEMDVPIESTVYVSHGAALISDDLEIDHELDPVLPQGVCGFRHSRAGADGQTSWEEQSLIPINTRIGTANNLVTIRGPGSAIDVDQDWQGSDGGPKNQLWDSRTSELVSTQLPMLSDGADSYTVRYELDTSGMGGPFKDCVVVVLHVLTAIAEGPPEV